MSRRTHLLVLASAAALLLATACAGPRPETAAPAGTRTAPPVAVSPAHQLATIAGGLDLALSAARAGDLAEAKRHYQEFDDEWEEMEGGVKKVSMNVYKTIEGAMDDVRAALVKAPTPNQEACLAALQNLRQTIEAERPKLGA